MPVAGHDWNSLLADPSHSAIAAGVTSAPPSSSDASLTLESAQRDGGWLLFRNFSRAYYPHADDLVAYLRAWAAGSAESHQQQQQQRPFTPLRVRYNTTVARVVALDSASSTSSHDPLRRPLAPRFRLSLADGSALTCTFLIAATGLQAPVEAAGVNMREAVTRGWVRPYHNASTDLSAYEGRRVLILGRGNAAFEFANALLEVASAVVLVGRTPGRLRLAYETHYPVRRGPWTQL